MTVKISVNFLTVDGERAGIHIATGPWVSHVPPDLIKIRCKKGLFPASFAEALAIENKSDMREDYFEADTIRLLPGHPLYQQAKALAEQTRALPDIPPKPE